MVLGKEVFSFFYHLLCTWWPRPLPNNLNVYSIHIFIEPKGAGNMWQIYFKADPEPGLMSGTGGTAAVSIYVCVYLIRSR